MVSEFIGMLPQSSDQLQQAIEQTDAIFKHGKTTTVTKLAMLEDALVLKRYNPRSQWHKVKRALRRSRALRCWRMSYAFQNAGLNVAQPIFMIEQRFGPIRLDAYFASRMLCGDELFDLLPSLDSQVQREVAESVNDAFARMRQAKVTHGDMKATNLIWSDGKLFFIDLDAAIQHRTLLTWRKSHQRDVKRFMKNWRDNAQLTALFEEVLVAI